MKIKVCGLKYSSNIEEILSLGVDFIGFIFYDKSLRCVDKSLDLSCFNLPDTDIKTVGVFVNHTYQEIKDIVNKYSLSAVQLHAQESPALCERLKKDNLYVIKAFSVDDNFNFTQTEQYQPVCDMFVFDTKTKLYGGSGHKFNWNKLSEYEGSTNFLLSGGISPDDVANIKRFEHKKCAGLDLNSAFEISPGKKNVNKLKKFISSIK